MEGSRPRPFKRSAPALDAGDIFSDVPLAKWVDGRLEPGTPGRAVITSHGCACEDYDRAVQARRTDAARKLTLQVAPLRSINNQGAETLDRIRHGDQMDYFYVYGDRQVADQILDFTREQPIPAYVLMTCNKIATLAEWQWRRLLVHLAVSRFHQPPEEIFRAEILGGPNEA